MTIRLDCMMIDKEIFYVEPDEINLTFSEARDKLLEIPEYEMICFSDYTKIITL